MGVGALEVRATSADSLSSPYAVIQRIKAQEEFFERVRKIEPRFMAVFGAETESIFLAVYSARTQLAAAAEQLFEMGQIETDDDERSRQDKKELRQLIFRGMTEKKEVDRIGD
jgi:hypothetical protein